MKSIILIVALVLFNSCADKKQETPQNLASSKEEQKDSISTIIGNINANDTFCLNEIALAKKEIAQNKLVYQISKVGNVAYGLNADELRELLAPYNIDCKTFDGRGPCIPMLGKQNCYFHYMNTYIKGKFKKGFIDSLEAVSLRNFLIKDNDEKCYEDIDRFYKLMYYAAAKSFETQQDDIVADFKASLKYPKGYIVGKGKENWHAYLHFIIDAKANVQFINVDVTFDDPANKKFEAYFINKIKQFISASKWIAAEIEGVKVSRRVVIEFNGS